MKNYLHRLLDPNDKKAFPLTVMALLLFCLVSVFLFGTVYTCKVPNDWGYDDIEAYSIIIEQDQPILEVVDYSLDQKQFSVKVKGISPGSAFLTIIDPSERHWIFPMDVYPLNIVFRDTVFGDYTGDEIIPISFTIVLAILLIRMIRNYEEEYRKDRYRYRNIRDLGLIIFLSSFFLDQIRYIFRYRGLIDTIYSIINSASGFAIIVLPIAFIVFILVTISNLRLMAKEGHNWRNMLGCLLGITVCTGTVTPMLLGEFLQRTTIVNVHNMNGPALYIELFVENAVFLIISYLECILLATIISAIGAARHVPSFDKDFIMILGCQINKDGSLTPLLRGRTERALEFAKMQKEKTGKEIIFVPSGGQGSDEVIPEARAIGSYLLSKGIPEDRILVEDKSLNTEENFKNSYKLIKERNKDPNIAFSTTNYHVFRAGAIASLQGIGAEGIGSTTKAYFWINAFIREYIATLFAERKTHAKIICLLLVIVTLMIGVYYQANQM